MVSKRWKGYHKLMFIDIVMWVWVSACWHWQNYLIQNRMCETHTFTIRHDFRFLPSNILSQSTICEPVWRNVRLIIESFLVFPEAANFLLQCNCKNIIHSELTGSSIRYLPRWITITGSSFSLQWRHNGRRNVSHRQLHDCLLSRYSDADQRKLPTCRLFLTKPTYEKWINVERLKLEYCQTIWIPKQTRNINGIISIIIKTIHLMII